MNPQRAITTPLVPTALLLALSACSGGGLGPLGDILAGGIPGQTAPQQGQLRAEIQQVNTQQQQIQVRTTDGQSGAVLYDQSTQVVYQQQSYPVTALERGDLVLIELQQTQSGEPYAQRILVEQSVQERTGQTGGSGQVQQFEGEVAQVDRQRGTFHLQSRTYGQLTVSLPYNPGPAAEDRFQALRSGDYVRIEGVLLGDNRVDLYQFR